MLMLGTCAGELLARAADLPWCEWFVSVACASCGAEPAPWRPVKVVGICSTLLYCKNTRQMMDSLFVYKRSRSDCNLPHSCVTLISQSPGPPA